MLNDNNSQHQTEPYTFHGAKWSEAQFISAFGVWGRGAECLELNRKGGADWEKGGEKGR